MIVRRSTLQSELKKLASAKFLSIDCETSGLSPHLGDRLFSIAMFDGTEGYYFNFHPYPGLAEDWVLPREIMPELQKVFACKETINFLHNAKFDLAMLHYEGLEVLGTIHDTEVGARMEHNRHLSYSLDNCTKRIGFEKSDVVKEYIKKHKLYASKADPYTGEVTKQPLFIKVPFDIMAPYALKDAEITFKLGMHQRAWIAEDIVNTQAENARLPKHNQLVDNFFNTEKDLVKVCLAMETVGIKVDRDFCERALALEQGAYNKASKAFKEISGFALVDSPKSLQKAFDAVGEDYGKTEKGNPSFTAKTLEGMKSPLAKTLLEYRKSYKKAHTYYQNFLVLSDSNGRLHANMRQAGTETTRFSYSAPNLQALTKNDKEEAASEDYLVRRAFIPEPDYCLICIDFNQMEFRFMLEYAMEMPVIEKVLAGLDVHTATAEMMNVNRNQAKTLNFLLLYGGGVGKLADTLGVDIDKARQLRGQYFASLPKVSAFTRRVIKKADDSEVIRSWTGFPFRFPMVNVNGKRMNFSYAAPNHLIQGGCAQVVRRAMVGCHNHLKGMKSRIVLQVHDEFLLEIHKSELAVIPELKDIMEKAYPHKHLPLTCSVSHSWKSWADKIEGLPLAERNDI